VLHISPFQSDMCQEKEPSSGRWHKMTRASSDQDDSKIFPGEMTMGQVGHPRSGELPGITTTAGITI
jgi:hypothetical protein